MTTTNDSAIRKIIALRDRARHASTPAPEAETALAMARKLCTKYGIDAAILDRQPETHARVTKDGQAQPQRKYSCRFGCPWYVQHTAEEMSACADRARTRSATGSAYDAPKTDNRDWFQGFTHAGYTYADEPKTKSSRPRSTGTHAYCSHEATKSARAKCRRERGY